MVILSTSQRSWTCTNVSMPVFRDGTVSEGDGYDVNYLFGQVEIKELLVLQYTGATAQGDA